MKTMLYDFLSLFDISMLYKVLGIILKAWVIWLPILVLNIAFTTWLSYKRREWIRAQKAVLLEVRLPSEMSKSPLAMEVFLNALHQTGVGSLTDVYFKGRVRPWFSLELVSDGGMVHFYIWTFESQRKNVETQLYAQFPNVEVYDAPDYTLPIQHDTKKYKFGKFSHIVLTKGDSYPIKTYIDYGLDKDPDEEYRNDPMAPLIEFLGSLKRGEHAWIQILLQGHTKEGLKYGRLFTKPDWKAAAEKEIEDIKKKAMPTADDASMVKLSMLSKGQQDIVSAIERSLSKFAFDTMIRVAYFAEVEAFNAANIGGILGVFKQFSSQTLNGFKPSGYDFDYPWQDFMDLRKNKSERKMLEAYKRRAIFNKPFMNLHDDKPYILTTEEVATIWHFPGAVAVATPTLPRIPSKKAEAPANLPI